MYLNIYCVGKLGQNHWQVAAETYLKYLRPFHEVKIIEVADERDPKQTSPAAIAQVLAKEGDRLLKALPTAGPIILLDVEGLALSTEKMAVTLADYESQGQSRLSFVIGGSYGLDPRLRQRAQARWSLSRLTFPHQLARVLLLEQLFRCAKINAQQTYHK